MSSTVTSPVVEKLDLSLLKHVFLLYLISKKTSKTGSHGEIHKTPTRLTLVNPPKKLVEGDQADGSDASKNVEIQLLQPGSGRLRINDFLLALPSGSQESDEILGAATPGGTPGTFILWFTTWFTTWCATWFTTWFPCVPTRGTCAS